MIDPAILAEVGTEFGRFDRRADGFSIVAGAGTDAFSPPDGGQRIDRLPGLRFALPDVPVRVSARVRPEFRETFDAGALVLRTDAGHWAKLAHERSPDGRAMAVSVVTRDTSDDSNGPVIEAPHLHLRIYRDGAVTAFHISTDGRRFDLLRLFALPGGKATIDFIAQSPMGKGCAVSFDQLSRVPGKIVDLRDGS